MINKSKVQEIAREAAKERKITEQNRLEALRKQLMEEVMRDTKDVESRVESAIVHAATEGKSRVYIPYAFTNCDDIVILKFYEETPYPILRLYEANPYPEGDLVTKTAIPYLLMATLKNAGFNTENLQNSQRIKISWNWRGNREPEETA